MAMAQSPSELARSRYAAAFTSSIFEPTPTTQRAAFVPAGKRRDQTTSEMFGNYDEKDLRAMPKTFVPKDDILSARQKKLQNLRSDVLPCSNYPHVAAEEPAPARPKPQIEVDEDDAVDTNLRRQIDLSSKLFGRETPNVSVQQLHDPGNKLTPNDFQWHSHPEPVHSPTAGFGMSHSERAYKEKCSRLFDHQSPQVSGEQVQAARQAREEENLGDLKRRANVYYSDLFGRSTPMDLPDQGAGALRRPKNVSSAEDRILLHQDWTDSKTELLGGSRSPRPEQPSLRKSDELHQARIFGQSSEWQPPVEKLAPVIHDNSEKLKNALGRSPQQIHQAHLRTSITPTEFYEEAESTKHWEVVELHLSGLPINADDGMVRALCQGFDLQIVKARAEMDPVRNLCKGRAKVMVRYNPTKGSIASLVQKLEDSQLRVEM